MPLVRYLAACAAALLVALLLLAAALAVHDARVMGHPDPRPSAAVGG